MLGENEVQIQNATDELVHYAFTRDDNTVTFVDNESCRLTYERIE